MLENAIDHPTGEVPFQSGSFPVRNGYAPEWAVVNYTMFRIARNAFFTVRNEYFDDVSVPGPGLPHSIPSIPSALLGGRTNSLLFAPSSDSTILTTIPPTITAGIISSRSLLM